MIYEFTNQEPQTPEEEKTEETPEEEKTEE